MFLFYKTLGSTCIEGKNLNHNYSIWNERKSEQAHIPHTPTLLKNAVYNEWQFQALVTGNWTENKFHLSCTNCFSSIFHFGQISKFKKGITPRKTRDLKGLRVDSGAPHQNLSKIQIPRVYSDPYTHSQSEFAQCILLWNSIYLSHLPTLSLVRQVG